MNYRITHFDDGKGKSQSHEVSISIEGDYSEISSSIEFPTIYGSTKEEAFQNCIEQFKESTQKINRILKEILSELSVDDTIEVDCFGKVVE